MPRNLFRNSFMVVNITVTKLNGGIRVNVATLKNNEPTAQEYDSVQQAGAVLLDMGVPKEAVDFYLSQLFPTITVNEELAFPIMEIPEYELWWRGFRFLKFDERQPGDEP